MGWRTSANGRMETLSSRSKTVHLFLWNNQVSLGRQQSRIVSLTYLVVGGPLGWQGDRRDRMVLISLCSCPRIYIQGRADLHYQMKSSWLKWDCFKFFYIKDVSEVFLYTALLCLCVLPLVFHSLKLLPWSYVTFCQRPFLHLLRWTCNFSFEVHVI